jgi:c-di-AMP phosphodiesterase-like protein
MKNNIRFRGKLRSYLYGPLALTVLLVVMNIPLYFYDVRCGAVFSGFTVVYSVVEVVTYCHAKPRLVNEIINYATQYATVQKKLLNEFEIPYALLDYNGKILWVNEAFTALTGADRNYHKSIAALFPSVTREYLQKNDNVLDTYIERDDRHFRISLNRIYFDAIAGDSKLMDIEESEEFLTAFYLFDETALNRYMVENQEQKLVTALLYIDNYDEALNSIEDVKRSLLVALIERRVNQYFSEVDALVRRTEKDKYFVVFKQKYLPLLEEDKFKLLEEVKSVKVGNEMSVTLSIGIGVNGETYNQGYDYARTAIDLALGRGGDQVVIKDGEEITYYGGKTKLVERNTRVKARVKAHALREIIESRENVLIMGHKNTDVDALGAGVGIYCAARVLGKKAQIVINNPNIGIRPLLETFSAESGYPEDMFIDSEQARQLVGRNTLVMVVDTNRPSSTECPELLQRAETVVVFDHHRQGSEVIENPALSYIEPYASSACEMVAEVLQYFQDGLKLESCEADCMYAGILVDTNNFMTKSGVRTFEAAAYLKRSGAETTRVRKMLRNDMDSYKAKAQVVSNAEVYRGAFAISVCPSENIESPTIVGAQAANELLNISGIRASFVLTQYNGKIYISSRSIDEINVQLIMERLGGGGHFNMAATQLSDCSIPEAKLMICTTIDNMLKEGDIEA